MDANKKVGVVFLDPPPTVQERLRSARLDDLREARREQDVDKDAEDDTLIQCRDYIYILDI